VGAARARLRHFRENCVVDRISATIAKSVRARVETLECSFNAVEFFA
jgi:hypothetical protein